MKTSSRPSIAVLIATCDRHESLLGTLSSIGSGDAFPSQIIIVDQSAIPIPEHGLNPELERRTELRIVRVFPPSLTRARNVGMRYARSEVVLFIDDDVRLAEHALGSLSERFADPGVALVAVPDRLLRGASSHLGEHLIAVLFCRKRLREGRGYVLKGAMLGRYPQNITGIVPTDWAQGFCFAVRRDLLGRSGLFFDENLPGYAYGEDLDFTSRFVTFARSIGRRAILDPSIEVDHLVDSARRLDSRASTLQYVSHRYYLSWKLFPNRKLYRLLLVWSDIGEAIRRNVSGQNAGILLQAHATVMKSAGTVSHGNFRQSGIEK